MPRLLVFDLDGTLIDSRRDLVGCVNATLARFGSSVLPDQQIAGFIGDGAAALIARSLQASAAAEVDGEEALAYFLQYYNEHLLDYTHLYPGILQALERLQSGKNAPLMAVLTNKPVRPSQRICAALGLAPFFFAIYGGNSFTIKKPHPLGLQTLCSEAETRLRQKLGPEEVFLIGDSEIDVRTARNAGVQSLGCTWGFATEKMLDEKPDLVAHSPDAWAELLYL